MSQNVEKTITLTEQELLNLSGFIEMLMRLDVAPWRKRDNPMSLGFHLRGESVEVKLWHRGEEREEWGPVWDQGTVNNESAGNRHGVCQRVIKTLFEKLTSP